ncbi:retrovirus-related pol polyprotein from transposon RE1 [Citrus sinensis]|nr:retrovirus-related pol polyprotein from transposon RE1 [Citrus sinensis]
MWKRTNQQFLGWLLSSMTESVLGIVLGCKTSFEVWKALEKLSSSQNKTRALQLKNQMMLTKKNDLSVYDYFHKMKGIADSMAAAGTPMSDYDFMMSVLGGIGSEFNPVAVLITGRGLDLDLSESLSTLMTHEGMLEQQALVETMDANLAFAPNFVKKGNNNKKGNFRGNQGENFYRGRKCGRGNNMHRGRSWNQGGRTQMPGHVLGHFSQPYQPRCQVCCIIGHTAATCKDRFNKDFIPATRYPHQSNYNQGYSQRNMSAYMATPEAVMDDGWYLDSGATHHLTNDLNNLSISEPYEGNEKLLIGNGHGLTISHIVSSASVPLHDLSGLSNTIIQPFQLPAASASSSSSSSSSPSSQTPAQKHHPSSHTSSFITQNTSNQQPSSPQAPLPNHPMITRAKADGFVSKYKAWLVAKGFHQTPGIDYFETFSPVVKQSTVRIILSLAVMKRWKIRQIDINNAFLNGELNEDVYMFQPEGFVQSPSGHVCKLHKALYGLKQAPRAWFDRLRKALLQWGFQNSKAGSSLFIKHELGGIVAIIVYVDDILITGDNNTVIETFIHYLGDTFALKDLGEFNYFLGIEVTHDAKGSLHLSQAKYVRDLLTRTDMENCRESDTPMSTGQKLRRAENDDNLIVNVTEYRSIIGALQYLVLTRPELAFSVNKLSQFLAAPTEKHWVACKKILRYLKATEDYGLMFKARDGINLTAYTDADWACDVDDRKSVGAYCVYLGQNLVSWSSKKQQTVARSSTESKYRALSTACAEIVWIQALLGELKLKYSQIPIIWCDNNGAAALATNPVYHAKTNHIELDVHFIREKVTSKQVEIKYVPSEWNIADVLTKPMAYSFFNYYRDKLNVVPRPLSLRKGVEMLDQQQQING